MKEKLAAIFKEMFEIQSIDEASSPENVEGWDSYTHIELMLELEEQFSVTVTTDEAVELNTVGKILAFLEERAAGV